MQGLEKICPKCAARFSERAIVCAYCGVELNPSALSADNVKPPKRRLFAFLLIVAGLVAVIGVSISLNKAVSKKTMAPSVELQQGSPPAVESQSALPVAEPEDKAELPQGFATGSVTPWQLLKNPFMQQGKLIRLDYVRFSTIYNGNIIHYGQCNAAPGICQQLGYFGRRFNRMIAANQGFYDVMGEEVETSVNIAKLGELIVDFGESEDQPPLNHDWVVVPEEPTHGTNTFGANIRVATVRFVRLASEGDAPRN
jgi:hypothetical protein